MIVLSDQPIIKHYNETKSICGGHRCPLGKCLSFNDICDGKMDCRDDSDESAVWCAAKKARKGIYHTS